VKRAHGVSSRLRALNAILKSKRLRSRLETLAIQRQIMDLEHGHERGLRWDEDEATRTIGLFDMMRHWKGEWAGRKLELTPHQEHCTIAPIFGWKREGGTRRFRTGYDEEPRKNGKTTKAAGVAIKGLTADGEPGAEVYAAATKRDQAAILFNDANQVRGPQLREITRSLRNAITCPHWNSTFQPLSSDYNSLDGLNIHFAIVDELHAHKTRHLWDVLDTATGARRQPLIYAITTAGHDRQSICWEQHEYAREILEGIREDDSYFAFIAGTDPNDDWRDPSIWEKANPNYGISVKPEKLQEACRKAADSPAAENNFRRKHLNQWTEQDVRWMSMSLWDNGSSPVDTERLNGRECFAGLDMAKTRDLASVVLVFPNDDGSFDVLPFYWCPSEVKSKQQESERLGYAGWIGKHITATEGNSIDQKAIRAKLWELSRRYRIVKTGFDPHNMTECYQQLIREGWENAEDDLLEMTQNVRTYNEAMKRLLDLLRDRKIRHAGHPVLRWNAANVIVHEDQGGNIMPHKGKSQNKIDGFCAMTMALSLAIRSEEENRAYVGSGEISFVDL
jgi:phage terminase large subunit-like protein